MLLVIGVRGERLDVYFYRVISPFPNSICDLQSRGAA